MGSLSENIGFCALQPIFLSRATLAPCCAMELALGNERAQPAGHSEIAAKLLTDLEANFHVFSNKH
jgi:hypothetical protein